MVIKPRATVIRLKRSKWRHINFSKVIYIFFVGCFLFSGVQFIIIRVFASLLKWLLFGYLFFSYWQASSSQRVFSVIRSIFY